MQWIPFILIASEDSEADYQAICIGDICPWQNVPFTRIKIKPSHLQDCVVVSIHRDNHLTGSWSGEQMTVRPRIGKP